MSQGEEKKEAGSEKNERKSSGDRDRFVFSLSLSLSSREKEKQQPLFFPPPTRWIVWRMTR
jgi:hypothetical protein